MSVGPDLLERTILPSPQASLYLVSPSSQSSARMTARTRELWMNRCVLEPPDVTTEIIWDGATSERKKNRPS